MPRPEFRKPATRRRPAPILDLLEGRALLNATSLTSSPAIEVHAEVMKVTAEQAKLAKQQKAEAAKEVKLEKAEVAKEVKQVKAEEALQAKTEAAKLKAEGLKLVKDSNPLTDLYYTVPDELKSLANNTTPVAGQYTPEQLETAYGTNVLPAITASGGSTIPNDGRGVTIAIVDELNDSKIISDANVYSAQYGLPQFNVTGSGGPTMVVDEDTDLASVGSASGTGVGEETSLDVELAHAMAPMANILLVEVPATGTVVNEFKELLEGIQFAAKQTVAGTPVVSVSLSYGDSEAAIGAANVTSQNSTYLATGAASNIAVTVSTGDSSTPEYPATSPNVIGVGGTSLFLASAQGDYGYETAWGGFAIPADNYTAGAGGGGTSTNFSTPAFQSGTASALGTTKRTIPDVSLVGDPYTGVSIYDSFDGVAWTDTGGTSVSSPMFAGILALAQQQRLDAGESLLTSVQVNTALYSAYTNPTTYADIFNDVTLGKNTELSKKGAVSVAGYAAKVGYDEATGLGSPWAAGMVPYLATGVDPYNP
jgi:subtilase family serine protease